MAKTKKTSLSEEQQNAILEQMQRQEEAQHVARTVIDTLLTRGARTLYLHHLDTLAPVFAARCLVDDMLSAVEWRFAEPDPGEQASALLNPKWDQEDEPVPAPIDTWASGAVPIRKRSRRARRVKSATGVPTDRDSRSETRSLASSAYFGTDYNRSPRRAHKSSLRRSKRPDETTTQFKPESIERAQTPAERERERLREQQLKKLERQKQIRRQVAEANRLEEQQAKKSLEELHKTLKGKQYTYDENGNVIVIKPVRPDRLPHVETSVRAGILREHQADDQSDAKKKRRGGRKAAAKNKTKKHRGERRRDDGAAFKLDTAACQPSPVTVLQPDEGVTLKDTSSGQVKKGPERSPLRQTRAEYSHALDDTSHQGGIPGFAAVSTRTPAAAAVPTTTTTTTTSKKPVTNGTSSSSDQQRAQTPSKPDANNSRLSALSSASDEPLTRHAPLSPLERFNASILADASWGMPDPHAQPTQPGRPGKYRQPKAVKARDRPFLSAEKQSRDWTQRRHLPAPQFPATSGHGAFVHDNANFAPELGLADESYAGSSVLPAISTVSNYSYDREFQQRTKPSVIKTSQLTNNFLSRIKQ